MQNRPFNTATDAPTMLSEVNRDNDVFYKISDVDRMPSFFMTVVSDSNHWLFISSNTGISAGRKNSEYALFPYYTDDKITASAEHTGSKTILQVSRQGRKFTWEPFSMRSEGLYKLQRNIYKSRCGNKIIFEEINLDLQIKFEYEWNSSNLFGFVRKARLENLSKDAVQINILDGLQNILPYGVGSDLINNASNLANAYKRSEVLPQSGLGIFALSAIITDKAEPSEALKANVVWSHGFTNPLYLLSVRQLDAFRNGHMPAQETDVKGEQGAYFICSNVELQAGEQKNWMLVANVNQSQANVIELDHKIQHDSHLVQKVLDDVEEGTKNLWALTAAADAIQCTSDALMNTRHFSNVLFNIMRGGIFDDGYQLSKIDFARFIQKANKAVYQKSKRIIDNLPESFSVFALKELALESADADFIRLATEYLPLKFSRRHGDPSRPWNKFTINTRSEIDGSKILDYQGNWRDIFQNWEALAHAYPAFIEGMIYKFLNASTFDGYNPYRVTKDGFDWETIEPDNPWSYIGYWGDHQIIYLLKFLEFARNHYPQLLTSLLSKDYFVYANVPYTIKAYGQLLQNPKDTIEFNHPEDSAIHHRVLQAGSDGALLVNKSESIHHVNFAEKVLATLLAKLTNLVPGGGIWMNTQRPEWNDANNALVGNGLSMVTLFYLRRFLCFLKPLFDAMAINELTLSEEMKQYFIAVKAIFEKYESLLPAGLNGKQSKRMLDELGEAGSHFRTTIYEHRFSGNKSIISGKDIVGFIDAALQFTEYTIRNNKRTDGLYHTYNILSYDENELTISHLDEMLEGQVAVLSSGFLSAEESLHLLDALKKSALYREDQNSYILYPNKDLPGFLRKNTVPAKAVQQSRLLKKMLEAGNRTIIEKDIFGNHHFNGNFRNAGDVKAALTQLEGDYRQLVELETSLVLTIFEEVFNHKAFTGRSGTFFAYEGLGSIYWHMVSKLQLAVQETCLQAINGHASDSVIRNLVTHYYEIREGCGVHKSPALYGAFPTDPYSHTPFNKGAQQPGMTGQVKEDIISRFGELGIVVEGGQLAFQPYMLRKDEFLQEQKQTLCLTVDGRVHPVQLQQGSLLFTYCQVPVIYNLASKSALQIHYKEGSVEELSSMALTEQQTQNMFNRMGKIEWINVMVDASLFRVQ